MTITSLVVPIVLVVLVAIIFISGYVKAPPDLAFIISGLHKEPRILTGRAGIKIPFLERVDKLYLGQMTVDIKTGQPVPTNDFINVSVDAVAKIRIITDRDVEVGTEDEPRKVRGILLASKNFLNMSPQEIAKQLEDSLQGNMREIIGTLDLRRINTDRDSFSDQVMTKASKDMEKLGIEIISCNIQNVTDENGLIKDLGMDNTSKIKKDAAIAKAVAEKEVQIAQAQANKEANEARVASETEIAEKNNALAIKKAELKKIEDTENAKADAAYEIAKQEQQKAIETNTVNAQIAKAERDAVLKEQEVKVQEQTLAATVKKQAEAEKFKLIQEAEAAAEQKKKQAEAARYAMEQEAAGIKAKGEAEAEAIRAKGLAEAEAIKRKSEAFEMAISEKLVDILPQMASAISQSVTAIDGVTIYDSGNGAGVSNFSGNTPLIMRQVFDTMSDATGVDFTEILKSQTMDAKITKNVNLTGLGDKKVADVVKEATESVESADAEVTSK